MNLGVASWIFVLPFDVIKSKIIADSLAEKPLYKNAWDCTVKTFREGGMIRFFRGFWLLSLRAFPVNGITFLVYEKLMETCGSKTTNESKLPWIMFSPRKDVCDKIGSHVRKINVIAFGFVRAEIFFKQIKIVIYSLARRHSIIVRRLPSPACSSSLLFSIICIFIKAHII